MTQSGSSSSTSSGPVTMWNFPSEAYQQYSQGTHEIDVGARDSLTSYQAATSSRIIDDHRKLSEFDHYFSIKPNGIIQYEPLETSETRYFAQDTQLSSRLFGGSANIESLMEVVKNYTNSEKNSLTSDQSETLLQSLQVLKEIGANRQFVRSHMASLTQG